MGDIVIKIEDLSKAYRIGLKEQKSDTMGDAIMSWVKSPMKNFRRLKNLSAIHERSEDDDIFWALKDISFNVSQGDIMGIIGKNGAGKSTLLKILSKITDPTKGQIEITGRVAALLEVGTGFNPDLTGRENTYLNGTILGMTRKEIDKKFDAIVDFSGVEKFIDTPVKRYSSGMKVRLGFAVAAHLDPEVLIVDEVLAVGDAEFQKKCLGKMKDISSNEGRTILFVTHNMAAVKQLCNKGVVLKDGTNVFEGSEAEAVNFYQNNQQTNDHFFHDGPLEAAPGNENIRILEFKVSPLSGEAITINSGFEFKLKFYNHKESINLDATFELRTVDDIVVFHQGYNLSSEKNSRRGVYTVAGVVPRNLLNAGVYTFRLIFGENLRYSLLKIQDIVQFEILYESLTASNYSVKPGIIRPNLEYRSSFETI